jgi:hypothetical protein
MLKVAILYKYITPVEFVCINRSKLVVSILLMTVGAINIVLLLMVGTN